MEFVSVILDIQTQALDATYTYAISPVKENAQQALFTDAELGLSDNVLDELKAKQYPVEVGACVLVPLGHRFVIGFIVSFVEKPDVEVSKIKPILAVLTKSYFNEQAAKCAVWLSNRYLAPLSSCVRLFVPPASVPKVVLRDHVWSVERPVVGEVDDTWVTAGVNIDKFLPRKNAIKQQSILSVVKKGDIRTSELIAEYGAVQSSLKSLAKAGAIKIEKRRRMREIDLGEENLGDIDLTEGQSNALSEISHAIQKSNGQVVVVDGVTGSGKTEVYLRAIKQVIDAGKTAIVLVPEISLTPQTVARFRGRFGNSVAVMHSRMTPGERYDQWDFIRQGNAKVVVGARSALFTPIENVGLIVIDEEHEGSYKQDQAPRYNSRDVAMWMMRQVGGTVVLGSATPSIDMLYCAMHNDYCTRVVLPERANGKPLPPISVVDMAKEFSSGHRSMFSRELSKKLSTELVAGHKAVLLLNQRGFAKFLLCRDCGFVPECPNCSTSLTYHETGNVLICHHCDYRIQAPITCPKCQSPYLKKFGAGTQRVEAELKSLISQFPNPANKTVIVRMDADTTKRRGSHQKLLEQFAREQYSILLGTQMIAKGLDFKDVTLVGVINADTQLHLPDYRAGERTFDLIQQVAGRAGRANLPGEVIVQTYEANSIAVQAAATYNREAFLENELAKRELLSYPPFVGMANILVWGKNQNYVEETCKQIRVDIMQVIENAGVRNWEVMPASACLLSKLRNTYRWHIVIKASDSCEISSLLGPYFRSRKADFNIHVAIDIDPNNLL